MRWYVTPANHSADGCVCETMSDGSGPTLSQHPAAPDASTSDGVGPSRISRGVSPGSDSADERGGGQRGEQAIVDEVVKAKFEELLSPVCMLHRKQAA